MNPSNLLEAIGSTVERAERLQALFPIETASTMIEEDGVPLQLLTITPDGLRRLAVVPKPINRGGEEEPNPFLPFEQDLHVADLTETHVAILNKFPVTRGHFLLITREFEEQMAPLSEGDFHALAVAMAGVDGLMMFNGGRGAGASQRHKHMQLVPDGQVYIEPWLPAALPPLEVVEASGLLFSHAFTRLDDSAFADVRAAANHLADAATSLLTRLELTPTDGVMPPYNLLATRRWMMAVPRSQTFWVQGDLRIAINAISFSGSLLVHDPRAEPVIRELGLRRILSEVT